MKTINKNIIITMLFALLVTTWCSVFGFVFNPDSIADPPMYSPTDVLRFSKSGSYKIDVETIFSSIDSGHSPIFLSESELLPIYGGKSEWKWTQAEHFKAANALFEFVWKETVLKAWSLPLMSFHKYCEENPASFESSHFVFNQLVFQGGEFNYKSRMIEISLPDEVVSWGGNSGYPRPLFGTNQFYLEDLKITADDALRIAEENGGKVARQAVRNECTISVSMSKNWSVRYYGPLINNSTTLFEATIDPYTGKVITLR